MRFDPFRPADLLEIEPQESQARDCEWLNADVADFVFKAGPAWSARNGEKIVAITGFVPKDEDTAVVWAVLSEAFKAHAISMARFMFAKLEEIAWPRVEMHVKPDNPKAQAWAEMFGFRRLGLLEGAHPSGAALWLYVRERG